MTLLALVSRVREAVFFLALVLLPGSAQAQAPVDYRLSFPAPEHRWMQVDVTFADVPVGPLQLRMSRSSPGRYALHEFAKNVFDVRITDATGAALSVTRPNLHQWDVAGHAGTVHVSYRVFGDRIDGTYLAIDRTHAHINMPSALIWARGLEDRGATVRFIQPSGASWRVATQLLPGVDEFTFRAPNLQYLMDSPTEFSGFMLRTFRVTGAPDDPLFRLAVHHEGTEAEVASFADDVRKIVEETRNVFGEYPVFDGGTYTFIGDYLSWAGGDAMEHRNSTFLTSPSSIRTDRARLLGSVSHEFFHAWNVERIRPQSLEPFNFEDANVSGELWLAEGFTNYYGSLILLRAGLIDVDRFVRSAAQTINTVTLRPGRQVRTPEEMSRMAPFVDAAAAIDRTSFDNTFISYYTWGEAIGLGLDLTLRARSDGKITLDHYMRALWQRYGRPGGRAGYVDNPYTAEDARNTLADISGDAAFAADFFTRYIQDHEVPDYGGLLGRAGFVLRPRSPDRAFAGELRLQDGGGGARIASAVPTGSPAYSAGLERDDVIVSLAGSTIGDAAHVNRALRARRVGEAVAVVFERRGQRVSSMIGLVADPRQEIVLTEDIGQTVTAEQRRFRDAWLRSAVEN